MSSELQQIANALTRIARAMEGGGVVAADFDKATCWRWGGGVLHPLPRPRKQNLSILCGLDEQITLLKRNIQSFLRGRPSNNVLLTGARGCGKSSVACGVFAEFPTLRLIETTAEGLADLPRLLPAIAARREKFILYCDDLSFGGDMGGQAFQRLKSALEGGLSAADDNLRIVATSNRRHLLAESHADNLAKFNEEINGAETIEEKISMSDRFGLWLPFFEPTPEEYARVVTEWLRFYKIAPTSTRLKQSQVWADERGSMNGRMARNFAIAAANKTAFASKK